MINLSRRTLFYFFLFFFFFLKPVFAQNLLIVEVQIAGEKSSDDYIKIYNPNDFDIYLGNYQNNYFRLVKRTKTSDRDYTIKSWSKEKDAIIPAKGFYVWANKDYTFVLADCVNSQKISPDNGIALRLGSENTGQIIDAVGWGNFNNLLFEKNPFPENPKAHQKLSRKKLNGSYQDTNDNSNDFYLDSNPEDKQINDEILETENQKEQLKEKNLISNYDYGIVFNEILPSAPLGIKDEQGEYIEIFNQNNFEVDLSDWTIEDTNGKTTSFLIPKNTKIAPKGFLIFYRNITKIVLNNEGDGLKLFSSTKELIDFVNYENAPVGYSFNRTPSGWQWSEKLTPGSENIISDQKNLEKEKLNLEKIDINSASLEDLMKIKYIGPARAQELISLRPFYSLEELTKIKGINEKALEEIKKQGLAWVDPNLSYSKEKIDLLNTGKASLIDSEKETNFFSKNHFKLSFIMVAIIISFFSSTALLYLKRKLK